MLQAGGELDLAPEPVSADSRAQFGRQQLDHHPPAERRLRGHEHPTHAAATQFALDPVCGSEGGLQRVQKIAHAGSVTEQVVSNPPRVLYTVVTTSLLGLSSRKRSSASRAVACS